MNERQKNYQETIGNDLKQNKPLKESIDVLVVGTRSDTCSEIPPPFFELGDKLKITHDWNGEYVMVFDGNFYQKTLRKNLKILNPKTN